MNKKGFTLIELIAVVVIMAIIALIATPNIVNMMDKGKKEDYVADAKEIISKATYMYKLEKYKEKFSGNRILLKNINGIDEDFKDPYGFSYDKAKSYVKFVKPDTTGELAERQVEIFLTSNNGEECYLLSSNGNDDIDTNMVKEGSYDKVNKTCSAPTS